MIVADGGAQHNVELAFGCEDSTLSQDRAAPVGASAPAVGGDLKRRATEKELADDMQASADDACKIILASGIFPESVKPTGFDFGGASSSGTAFGIGTPGSVVFGCGDESKVLPPENSFAGFANLDYGKWNCLTSSSCWDESTPQCKACECYRPGFSEKDVAQIGAEKGASTIGMFLSSSHAKPTLVESIMSTCEIAVGAMQAGGSVCSWG